MKSQSVTDVLKKAMRVLEQDTGTVAGVFLTATRTAVIQILQDRQRLLNDLMGLIALNIYDEPDTTRIVLKSRIIKPLFGRNTGVYNIHIFLSLTVFILIGAPLPVRSSGHARFAAGLRADIPFQLFNSKSLLRYDRFHEVAYGNDTD